METAETLGLPQKPTLARLLVEHADRRGWIDWSPEDFANATGYDVHDVVHAFWDFQKKGQMKFREEHIGDARRLVSLRLTASGRQAMFRLAAPTPPDPEPPYDIDGPVAVTAPEPKRANGLDALAAEVDERRGGTVATDALAAARAFDVYPLIEALIDRRDKLVAAAHLLDAAGEAEMALMALERADGEVYSPLEAEAVRLYRATVGRGA